MIRYLFLVLLSTPLLLNAQQEERKDFTIFLIGDCGEPSVVSHPVGKVLREQVIQSGAHSTVIYLGDNIYPKGMPESGSRTRIEAETILQTQANWIKDIKTNGIFIPGNHDWKQGRKEGWQYILYQQHFLDSLYRDNVKLLPRDGCPGPVEIPLNDKAVLVIIDSQWLLHPWDKPGSESSCDGKTAVEVLSLLQDIFHRNSSKRVIIAGHHPVISYGEHGGEYRLKDHIFPLTSIVDGLYLPLPVVGSIYPLYRKWFGNIQDTAHPLYKAFSSSLQNVMRQYSGSIYVSGHEHNLQYIVKDSSHFIVSGSGAKTSYAKQKGFSVFADDVNGFVQLIIRPTGVVVVHYWQVDEKVPGGKIIFSDTLSAPKRSVHIGATTLPDFSKKTIRVSASHAYSATPAKQYFLGRNYRSVWSQKIDVPLFDIGREQGGLSVVQKGGGMQTLSLRLEDSTGREFVLRSVEKYPEKALPIFLQKTFAQSLVQDQISASHPYAALVVPGLAEAAGIYHTNPKLVYVPDDPRLGEYQKMVGNTLALFEERPAGDWSGKSFFGNSDNIINTSKVLERLLKDNDNRVDQEFALRSRLFDLIIGDWDRHNDQWRWATFKSKKGELYRPIPRDRDQAFFVNEGIFPKLLSRKWALPLFEGFEETMRWPSGMSFSARYFDRLFLNELSQDDWIRVAKKLQQNLTDEVIEKSIREWPEEIFSIRGEEIIRKLKARRDKIDQYAIEHYTFISLAVDVVGSNKDEIFEVIRQEDGDVEVKVFKQLKDGERGKKLYSRIFLKKETKEIRLYGMGGKDAFMLSGNGKKGIRIRIIGGEGEDRVHATTRGTLYYDVKGHGNVLVGSSVMDKRSVDPLINQYDSKSFKYNRLAPLVFGGFNPDDGVFIGGGFLYQTEGFRKSPFKQRHIGVASIAPLTSSYNFLYRGDFTDVLGKWGLELNADIKSPNYVNNFFGLGNETVFDKSKDDDPSFSGDDAIDYYRFRFEEQKMEVYLTRRLGGWGSFKFGPAFQRIEVEEPQYDRFISDYAASLPYNLFTEYNAYTGVSWKFTIDQRNDQRFTTRGIVLNISGRNMVGNDARASDFSSFESAISFYHAFRLPARVAFAVRAGGGWNTGDYEFYQAQILGGRDAIRGYRKTRFYGDSKFYSNLEMRIKLFNVRTYLFPASVGLLGFHDFGRVWYKDVYGLDPSTTDGTSNRWHKGWGGGLWFTPFNLTVLSVEGAHSRDGMMGYIRLGFLF
ncbi:MAG: BamA/TamA family outer membrane protein [Cyclobacteriaceae bacterium]|nr:BamA/TamA family outer membrane protein [Cyclobacteriaceae bacterium]